MIHTYTQFPRSARAKAATSTDARRYQFLAMATIAMLLVLLLNATAAHAKTEDAFNAAAIATTGIAKGGVDLRGACHKGVAVFTVKNNIKTWTGRGHLRITDGQTGHVLRERWLRFAEGQSATFRIKPEMVESGRFKISVMLPDRSMTYKKSFRGRCTAPTVEAYNARR